MRSDEERDAARARWNAALATGDAATIEQARADILESIHARQLEDWDVHTRTRGGGANERSSA